MKSLVWTNLLKYVRSHRTLLNILLKYGIALGVLAYMIVINWSGLKDVLSRPIHAGSLVIATVIFTGCLLLTFFRWYLLVCAIGLPFRLYDAIRLGLVGYYFNTFLPGSVGGDIIKAYAIARDQKRRTVAVATVLIDRIIGLWALIWFVALIGSTFWILDDPLLHNPSLKAIVVFTTVFVAVSMAIWFCVGFLSEERSARIAEWFAGIRKIGPSLAELWRACWMYRKRSRAVLIAMLLSLVGHTGWVLVFHYSVHAFEIPATELGDISEHMIVVPVGMTVSALIPLPGGIGSGEAAYGRLYEILGKNAVNGIVGCMAQRVIFVTVGFLGYLIYTRMRVGMQPNEASNVNASVAPPDPDDPGATNNPRTVSPETVPE